jgi:hypothetical protein
MAKIKLYMDNANVMRNRVSLLGMNVRSFVERTIGHRSGPFFIEPKKLSREWLRDRILNLISLATFTVPTEIRDQDAVFVECVSRYGTAVGKFIEENLDLIAEIKMGVDAEESGPGEGHAKAM